MQKRKELNTSKYNFKAIIQENCMYVDKTKDIYRAVSKTDGQFFLSHPRRFGKSLLVNTMDGLFSSNTFFYVKSFCRKSF